MSDSDFVDVGDELVVKISGVPVDTAIVREISQDGVKVSQSGMLYWLPLDFKKYDTVDGYGHHSQPLDGIGEPDL